MPDDARTSQDRDPVSALSAGLPQAEPLLRREDVDDFHQRLADYREGRWDGDRWRTYRLRYGIYAQRQEGLHMIRIKIPGGRLSFAQARGLAALNAKHCGASQFHFTTRQDAQIYNVPTAELGATIESIFEAGLTTRESSGATFRNVTTCPLAGVCPREHLDPVELADRLTLSWLRHPLVQHMPRKFKTAVSGCAHDCGATRIDDLGFIAYKKDGKLGFRVVAGGGLGAHPRLAVDIFEFVEEKDLAAVQEAIARVHNAESNRQRRNTSRVKFLVDKFGQETFAEMVQAEFAKIKALPQRPWTPLAWKTAEDGPAPGLPGYRFTQTDGREGVILRRPLGRYRSEEFAKLIDAVKAHGGKEFRVTRDQNVVALGLPSDKVDAFISAAETLGHTITASGDGLGNVAACPGTSTCPIGITNSTALAWQVYADRELAALPEHRIRISGCQNSCGHHHIADFGLHGLGKKVEGKHAPHYQVHVGGGVGEVTAFGVTGPLVPSHGALPALKLLITAFHAQRKEGETPRLWAERIGEEGLEDVLAKVVNDFDPANPAHYVDIGMNEVFTPPTTSAGECAAPAIVVEYLDDRAEVGRVDLRRRLAVGEVEVGLAAGRDGLFAAARRLLMVDGVKRGLEDEAEVLSQVKSRYSAESALQATLEAALAASNDAKAFGPALDAWVLEARRVTEQTISAYVTRGVSS